MGHPSEHAPTKPVVLIVEDDFAVRNSLKFSLEIERFSVRAYESGLELLKDIPFAGADCLIVGYRLPEVNGLELVADLRRRRIALPAAGPELKRRSQPKAVHCARTA